MRFLLLPFLLYGTLALASSASVDLGPSAGGGGGGGGGGGLSTDMSNLAQPTKIPNNEFISQGNAANSADLNVIGTDQFNRTVVGNSTAAIIVNNTFFPASNATFDMGTGGAGFRTIYTNGVASATGTTIFNLTTDGAVTLQNTVTPIGTTGSQTINKMSGTVNIAAAGTTATVTNSLVTANSIVLCVIRTADTTAVLKNCVPSSGQFIVTLNSAATAATSVGFVVFNQ